MNAAQHLKLLINAKRLQQSNKLPAAKLIYLRILKEDPNNADALHLLGILYTQTGQLEEAIKCLSQTMLLNPSLPQVYYNLGHAYYKSGTIEKAIHSYQQALQLNPRYIQALHQLANCYDAINNRELVIQNFEKALAYNPNEGDIWADYGLFLLKLKKMQLAKQCLEKAVACDPKNPHYYYHLAHFYSDTDNRLLSIDCYKKVLKIKPDFHQAQSYLLGHYDQLCDWQQYDSQHKKLLEINRQLIQQGQPSIIEPFSALTHPWTPMDLATAAQSEAKMIATKVKPLKAMLNFQFNKSATSKLRLGYLSSGFNNHPTTHLAYNLFALHQRSQFEVFAFTTSPDDQTSYRQHMASTCDHFIDLSHDSDLAAAKQIYQNNIDIFIDLDGYIRGHRLEIAALRPAPIQVSYLGFPGTVGSDFFDYAIVDNKVVTPETAKTYSENLVYMPHSYQINNYQSDVIESMPNRQDYQLPENAIVYCCFNNTYKIEPKIFSVWMNILKAVPHSVLWLLSTADVTETHLRQEASLRGVDPARLIFAKREARPLYLARYTLADLFLDTLYYNAHTTGSDALSMGLPVLTCPGINFPSRVGASLLHALDVPELIMPNLETYTQTAIHLGLSPQELSQLKTKIKKHRDTQPLFDTSRFVKNLEKAFQQMWMLYQSGKKPQSITVTE